MKNRVSRRGFLKTGALAAAAACAPNIITSFSLFGAEGQPTPNDRINVGIIGMGKRGNTWMIPNYLQKMKLRLVAICDVDALKLDFAKQRADALIAESAPAGGKYSPTLYRDFRELLARPDIDLVDISTPDHWHVPMTLRAFKAGKDVVCTKPPTLGVAEGRALVEYWKKTDRVFTSTEILNDGFVAKKLIRSGQFGKLKEVHLSGWPMSFAGEPLTVEHPVPEGLDWDLWLGPATKLPYNNAYHYHCDPATTGFNPWAGFRPFGGGHLADWGGHLMGPAVFAGDLLNENGPVEVKVHMDRLRLKPPDNVEPKVEWLFGNGTRVLAKHVPKEFSERVHFVGENGDTSFEA